MGTYKVEIPGLTINTVTKLKVNYKHNFKDNLISLLYSLPTSVTNIEHQSFFKMALSYRSRLQALPTLGVHWVEIRATEGPITWSNEVQKIPQSQSLVELALQAVPNPA